VVGQYLWEALDALSMSFQAATQRSLSMSWTELAVQTSRAVRVQCDLAAVLSSFHRGVECKHFSGTAGAQRVCITREN
jgi:hypothetical protein